MGITVEQAMKIGGLKACAVVAGHQGLERMLKVVTVMEVPDIVRWLKGGELLLTSLYPIKDDAEAQAGLVRNLAEKGISALAIKPHRFIDAIPSVILEEADSNDFPIIEIPEEVSYLDILGPVMNTVFHNKVVIQEDLEQAYKLLDEIKYNKDGDIDQLRKTLSYLTKYDVQLDTFVSYMHVPEHDLLVAPLTVEQKRELEMIQRPIHVNRWNEKEESDQDCLVAPVIIDGRLVGAITCIGVETGLMEVDLAILERGVTVLSMELMKKKALYELEQQYKSDFFRDLLFSPIQHKDTLLEKGDLFGFDVSLHYRFVTIQFSRSERDLESIAELVTRLEVAGSNIDPRIITGTVQNGLYMLYPTVNKSEDKVRHDFQLIHRELKKMTGREIYIGIGRSGEDIREIREGYEQSQQAVILGRSLFGNRDIIHYEELGFYRLLAEVRSVSEMKKFYGEGIGVLEEYDENHDLELVRTLTAYFHNNESMSKTAEDLFIHINTLKYRLQRIKSLTGLHVKNSEDKLILHIGLKIRDFIKYDYRF